MSGSKLHGDRYHYTQLNFSLTKHSKGPDNKLLADKNSVFYVTQRKKRFAPCVGHERLRKNLIELALDVPHLRFLNDDKANLKLAAERLTSPDFPHQIRTMAPGTIVFAGEPFADITGPFGMNQLMELKFEHSFDEPMTAAANALEIRLAAGDRHCSDFSNRRDGKQDRSVDIAEYTYIGGLDDTSNMEAAYQLGINSTGTMAHYTVQAFQDWMYKVVLETDKKGRVKHFQQIAFERWLDAHPNGTTLLLDTISLELGTKHAIRATKSSEAHFNALKFVRIDSGDLIKGSHWVRAMLDANGLQNVGIILTSDLNAESIREIVLACPFVSGFGIGTKIIAETTVAGVIFKLAKIGLGPTMKCSADKPSKSTIPGYNQVWRCIDKEGYYIKDVISMYEESRPYGSDIAQAWPLMEYFNNPNKPMLIPSPAKQREFVLAQLKQFRDIYNYPIELSGPLNHAQAAISSKMLEDPMGDDDVVVVPRT